MINKVKKKLNFLDKKIAKKILILSLPIIFGNLLQLAYQLTDLFWIGRLGTDEIAGLSASMPILFMFISLGIGMSIGGLILISQEFGKKTKEKINYISSQMLFIMTSLGILISSIGYYLTPFIVNLNSSTAIVKQLAIEYTQISFLGMTFVYLVLYFKDLNSGIQEMFLPLKIVLLSVILNLIIDPLFIIYFNLGIKGAAYATILTQSIAALIGIIILLSKKYKIQVNIRDVKPNFNFIKKIFKIGTPTTIEVIAIALAELILFAIVSNFSTTIIAAFGISIQIFNIVLFVSLGILIATSVLVGESTGLKQKEKSVTIGNTSITFGVIVNIIIAIIVLIFAESIINIFSDNTSVIETGATLIRILAFTFPLFGIQKTLVGLFQGSGNPQYATNIAIISLWLVQIPLAYILSNHTWLEETGIWIAMVFSSFVGGIISFIVFKKEKWNRKSLVDNN